MKPTVKRPLVYVMRHLKADGNGSYWACVVKFKGDATVYESFARTPQRAIGGAWRNLREEYGFLGLEPSRAQRRAFLEAMRAVNGW